MKMEARGEKKNADGKIYSLEVEHMRSEISFRKSMRADKNATTDFCKLLILGSNMMYST